MANYMSIFGFVIVALVLHSASAATHTVLENSGWIVPGNDSVYRTWSASKKFQIGDTLVFNYQAGTHDVAQVSKAGYDACNGTTPIKLEMNSPVSLTLDTNGEHYYICTFEGHCQVGQKLAVTVGDTYGSSTPTSPAPLSPPNMPPKAPSPNTPPQAPSPGMPSPPNTPSDSPPTTPSSGSSSIAARNEPKKVIIIAVIVAGTLLTVATIAIVFCCLRRKPNTSIVMWERKTEKCKKVEAFLKDCKLLELKRCKYKDVKKMTNSFKHKIGQGGYGSVFKGQLHDGKAVAVKVLSESKGNGNEFINEVAAIARTSHVNIVTLLGFCIEGTKRALIYEFMPNGSLEKFIYNKITLEPHFQFGWEKLYKIAIGIARGLEYLHRGCNKQILHFDIKPHNILLDEDFAPKIADFGLSKLYNVKESLVSMTSARGTPGYIAPELFSRNFGGVSHKADVYSYGMMILEMVGGRKNIDVRVTNISEIYFPHWIYKRLDLNEDLGLHGITTVEDQEIAQKMVLVGLWCIQMDPLDRPPMSKVLDMLRGSLDALQIPPKPFLTSSSRKEDTSMSNM